jgi:hypothetical protein
MLFVQLKSNLAA